jgi:hypothetical protein
MELTKAAPATGIAAFAVLCRVTPHKIERQSSEEETRAPSSHTMAKQDLD